MKSCLLKSILLVLFMTQVYGAEGEETRPIILLLLGPPGSGRDALAVKVSSSLSLPYISTADLLLDYSDDESETGRFTRECLNTGRIPDELLLKLIADRVKRSDCSRGFLLDGYPKSAEQARALKVRFSQQYRMLPAYIRASEEWLLTVHEGRLVCTNCGRVYHQDRSPPQNEEVCDICGYALIRRSDDSPEALKKRSDCYRDHIMPILSYYSLEGTLVEIDGDRSIEEMFLDVKLLINSQHSPKH